MFTPPHTVTEVTPVTAAVTARVLTGGRRQNIELLILLNFPGTAVISTVNGVNFHVNRLQGCTQTRLCATFATFFFLNITLVKIKSFISTIFIGIFILGFGK